MSDIILYTIGVVNTFEFLQDGYFARCWWYQEIHKDLLQRRITKKGSTSSLKQANIITWQVKPHKQWMGEATS